MCRTGRAWGVFALVAVASIFAPAAASAQSVHWNPPIEMAHGQIAKIELVFEQCSPEGEVEFPETPAFEVVGPPTESRVFSMINFDRRSTVTLGYPVRPLEQGVVELPSFEVETSEGRFLVPKARLRVVAPSLSGGPNGRRQALSEIADAELTLSDPDPWAGQVVDLTFDVSVDARRQASLAGPVDWDPAPMVVEPWGDAEQVRPRPGRNGVRMRTRGLFPDAGRVTLGPASQDINVETEQSGGGLFSRRRVRTVTVSDESSVANVRPLPTPAPPGFDGAVGRFELTSSLAPEEARVGEPITWTLRMRGKGNWTTGIGLPPRSVPNDVEVIRPKTLRSFEEGSLFEGEVSEDLVLIPTRPGALRLEPVRIVYFDPRLGQYETVTVTPPVIEVRPATGSRRTTPPASSEPAPNAGAKTPAARAGAPDVAGEVGVLPGAREEPHLPRDPVAGPPAWGSVVSSPFTMRTWLAGLLVAWLPGLAWIAWLGRRRSVAVDPLAPRREARARVEALLEEAAGARGEVTSQLLLAWQRSAAELLGVVTEAPTEARMQAAGWGREAGDATGVDAEAWHRLWRESEAAIHGVATSLPPDWVSRARTAFDPVRIPRVPLAAAIRPSHVWPAMVMIALVLAPAALSAESERPGLRAYREGRFDIATQDMADRVARVPLDWKARSDLGLAHLQQGELEPALAEAAAAFAQRPFDEALRWNLAVTARRAGWVDPLLRDLAFGGGADALARWLPVGAWQLLAWSASGCMALLLASAVSRRHRGRSTRPVFIAAGVALAATGVCGAMVLVWGALASPDAAVVRSATAIRSLPTELDVEQVELDLEAGRVVDAERALLGWVQVQLANGDRGWVRAGALAPVYHSLATSAP